MKAGFPSLLAAALAFALPARATVSIEFQLGGIEVPAGSIGVLVADVADNGFTSPTNAAGSVLTVGETIGADDVIIAILTGSNLPSWGSKTGFANHVTSIDYAALGVAEGQDLILHVIPDRDADDTIRAGQPHLSYRGDNLERTSNSTMGFTLPQDGGAYLLAHLASEHSGNADLAGLDLSTLAYNSRPGSINRSLSSATARHTYFFNVTTPGILALEGTGGPGLRAELYGPDGELIAGSDGNILILESIGTGFHTLVVFRNSGSTPLAYGMDFSDGDPRPIVPDVAIGRSLTGLVGNNVLGGAPGQFIILNSGRARSVTAFATVGNRSNRSDTLAVRGGAGTGLCKISYFDAAGSPISAALLNGTYRTTLIGSADPPASIRIQFRPNKRRLVRHDTVPERNFSTAIRADSTVGPAATDTGTVQLRPR